MDVTRYIEENSERFDVVAVFGGDGTLNEATNGLMKLKHKPVISYFPTGTMNDFGTNFGLTNDMKQCATVACVGHVESFDVGKINSRYFNYAHRFVVLEKYFQHEPLKSLLLLHHPRSKLVFLGIQ